MPTIHRFFNQDVIVKRMSDTGDGIGRAVQTISTVKGHVQVLDERSRGLLGITNEKAFKGWFDLDTNILEDDILEDENGVRYQVREVVKRSYGVNVHLEVLMMEQNP